MVAVYKIEGPATVVTFLAVNLWMHPDFKYSMFISMHLGCSAAVLTLLRYHCFQLQWQSSWVDMEIVVKELAPIVNAALWGRSWHHTCVCFHSDNTAVHCQYLTEVVSQEHGYLPPTPLFLFLCCIHPV